MKWAAKHATACSSFCLITYQHFRYIYHVFMPACDWPVRQCGCAVAAQWIVIVRGSTYRLRLCTNGAFYNLQIAISLPQPLVKRRLCQLAVCSRQNKIASRKRSRLTTIAGAETWHSQYGTICRVRWYVWVRNGGCEVEGIAESDAAEKSLYLWGGYRKLY